MWCVRGDREKILAPGQLNGLLEVKLGVEREPGVAVCRWAALLRNGELTTV